ELATPEVFGALGVASVEPCDERAEGRRGWESEGRVVVVCGEEVADEERERPSVEEEVVEAEDEPGRARSELGEREPEEGELLEVEALLAVALEKVDSVGG